MDREKLTEEERAFEILMGQVELFPSLGGGYLWQDPDRRLRISKAKPKDPYDGLLLVGQ